MTASTKRAFTLIELIVVMAIIVTLSVIGFISYNSYIQDSRNAAREAQLNDIVKSIDQFVVANGIPPKCNTPTTNYCYFTKHSLYSASKAKGTTGGWNPGTSSYGPGGEGILATDWDKLNIKNLPSDPRGVYFMYAYNGSKYLVMATKEVSGGYAAIVKGSQAFEQITAEVGNPDTNNNTDTNVISSASGLGIRLDGETVVQGVIQVANPLMIKYNGYTSTQAYPTVTGNASVPYSW